MLHYNILRNFIFNGGRHDSTKYGDGSFGDDNFGSAAVTWMINLDYELNYTSYIINEHIHCKYM